MRVRLEYRNQCFEGSENVIYVTSIHANRVSIRQKFNNALIRSNEGFIVRISYIHWLGKWEICCPFTITFHVWWLQSCDDVDDCSVGTKLSGMCPEALHSHASLLRSNFPLPAGSAEMKRTEEVRARLRDSKNKRGRKIGSAKQKWRKEKGKKGNERGSWSRFVGPQLCQLLFLSYSFFLTILGGNFSRIDVIYWCLLNEWRRRSKLRSQLHKQQHTALQQMGFYLSMSFRRGTNSPAVERRHDVQKSSLEEGQSVKCTSQTQELSLRPTLAHTRRRDITLGQESKRGENEDHREETDPTLVHEKFLRNRDTQQTRLIFFT